jgi:hypothetical protein
VLTNQRRSLIVLIYQIRTFIRLTLDHDLSEVLINQQEASYGVNQSEGAQESQPSLSFNGASYSAVCDYVIPIFSDKTTVNISNYLSTRLIFLRLP